MLEILLSCWELLLGLLSTGLDLIGLVLIWVYDVLHSLHVKAPRLEGLLVGISLSWVLLRRDKHPLLRVLSAPLKLVLDILDLAWDQCVEVLGDLWETVRNWFSNTLTWCTQRVKNSYNTVVDKLKSIKDKLKKKSK